MLPLEWVHLSVGEQMVPLEVNHQSMNDQFHFMHSISAPVRWAEFSSDASWEIASTWSSKSADVNLEEKLRRGTVFKWFDLFGAHGRSLNSNYITWLGSTVCRSPTVASRVTKTFPPPEKWGERASGSYFAFPHDWWLVAASLWPSLSPSLSARLSALGTHGQTQLQVWYPVTQQTGNGG